MTSQVNEKFLLLELQHVAADFIFCQLVAKQQEPQLLWCQNNQKSLCDRGRGKDQQRGYTLAPPPAERHCEYVDRSGGVLQMLVRDNLKRRYDDQNKWKQRNLNSFPTGEGAESHYKPHLDSGHLVSRTAAVAAAAVAAAVVVVIVVMAARWHHSTLRPISRLRGGVSFSRSGVGRARRGQSRGGWGGRPVRRCQLSQTLRSRSPLRKACIILKEEHCSAVYCSVVHLISGSTHRYRVIVEQCRISELSV